MEYISNTWWVFKVLPRPWPRPWHRLWERPTIPPVRWSARIPGKFENNADKEIWVHTTKPIQITPWLLRTVCTLTFWTSVTPSKRKQLILTQIMRTNEAAKEERHYYKNVNLRDTSYISMNKTFIKSNKAEWILGYLGIDHY